MLGDTVEHLFFLDYRSYPIAMRSNVEYRVTETRTVTVMNGRFRTIEFRHLVEELNRPPL